jgi:hypothetical protein
VAPGAGRETPGSPGLPDPRSPGGRRAGERWDPEHGLKAEDPSNPEILPPPGQFVPSDYLNFYPPGEVWEPTV